MKDNNQNYTDWDESGVYGTGRTEPPKDRGGLLAVLLILVIFLCGLVTILGLVNIKLFQKLNSQEPEDPAMFFSDTAATTAGTAAVTEEVAATVSTVPQETAAAAEAAQETHSIDLETVPSATDASDGGELSLQDIYSRNIVSVVSVSCTVSGGTSSGTGVILTEDGYIVTNAHVVEDAGSITAQLTDGRSLTATLVGLDSTSDLAVLQVEADDLTPAQFGDSSTLRVGDTVVAIGDPLGVEFRGTYTNGIISGIDRDVEVNGRTMTLIQTNAALNSGNSGGPLINTYGLVVGINTMKIGAFTDSAGVEGLGFAIPSTTVKEVVEQLIAKGYVSGRPTLGIEGEGLSAFYQHYYRMPEGLYITEVSESSDAYAKGIQEGDILLSVDDTQVTSEDDLASAIFGREVGDTVQVVIFRSGQRYQVELTLTEDRGTAADAA